MVNDRTPSSVTSGTNSSPNCVGSVAGDEGFESSVYKSIERKSSESESSVKCDLLQSFTMVDDASQGDLHNAHLGSTQDEEHEPYNSAELLGDDDVENHEVELKDVVGLFGGDDVGVKGEGMPAGRGSGRKGMKKMFMSQKMKLNPKLKNFMMSTLTSVKDSKTEAEFDGDESFEVSLNKLDQSNIGSSEDRFETTEADNSSSNSNRLETVDEFEVLKEDVASNVTDEDAFSELDAPVYTEAVLSGMSNDSSAFDSGENEGTRQVNAFNSSKVLDSKSEESVELSFDHMQQSFECANATDTDNSTEIHLDISQINAPPIKPCFTSDGSKEDGNTSIVEGDGFKCNIFEAANDLETLQAEFHDGERNPEVSHDDGEKTAGPNAQFEPMDRHDHSNVEDKDTENTEIPADEVGEKSGSKNDKYRSLKAKSWSEFVSGEREGAGGMKRLISRVRSTPRVRSFLPTKSFEPKCEEVPLQQDAQQDKDELASRKVVQDSTIEDDLDSNGFVALKNEGSASQVKTDQSDLDMSVFGRTRSKTESKSVPTVDEQEEKPLEFLQMKVTLKFKALAGVSQVSSRRKVNSRNGVDGTVKAVATYRRNTIASDRFVSTHVPSLPILTEKSSQSTAQVYAQWPGCQQKDDESTASGMMMSSVTFTRTVRRVRNFDNVSSGGTAGGSKAKEPNEKDGKRFLASLSKAFAPELLDLQVGLMRGSNEIVPLGIATIVIPGEYKSMQLDIPVVRNYCTGEQAASKKKRGVNISQFSGKAKPLQDDIYFSTDKETKYKINEGAFLRLELNIEPAATAPALSVPPRHLNANTHKAQFRSGPINQALRRRRKMDYLMSLKKLPLHQRVQLYLELRNRKGGNANKALPNSHEVYLTKQSEVSEVSCEVQPQSIDQEAGLLMDQFDMRHWSSGLDTVEELSKGGDSLPGLKEATVPSASAATANAYKQDATPSVATKHSNSNVDLSAQEKGAVFVATADANMKHSNVSADLSTQEKGAVSVVTTDTHMKDETKSLASQHSNGSAKLSHQPEEKPVPLTPVESFLANDEAGISDQDDDVLSHFSSSLHSVFTTDHPQKHDIVQRMMDLLGCEPYLAMCEEERSALKYYAYEHEDTKCARHYCVPSVYEEFSDEDTAASFESVPIKVNRRSDPFLVDA